MNSLKVRPNGIAPYSIVATNDANTTIHSGSTSADEYEIPKSVTDALGNSGIKITVTDSSDKVGVLQYTKAELIILGKYHVGRAVANGNVQNHLDAINYGQSKGFTYTGVIYGSDEIRTDAALLGLDDIVLDHTAPLNMDQVNYPFDNAVKLAYQQSACKHLRVGIEIPRNNNRINNGGDKTLFFSEADAYKRPNGALAIEPNDNGFPSSVLVCVANSNVIEYVKRLTVAFFKRYLNAINDGTIAWVGLQFTTNAEGEYEFNYGNQNGTHTESTGDFNPAMTSAFKAMFTQYSGLSDNDISNADRNGSQLALDWTWFLNYRLHLIEKIVSEHVMASVPGLTRKKWMQHDSGSFIDTMAPRRRTLNLRERLLPVTFLLKSNDGSGNSLNHMKFAIDHISSHARLAGACAIVEPSPEGFNFESEESRGYIRTEMLLAYNANVGISWIIDRDGSISQLMTSTGLIPGSNPKYKNEFAVIGGNKKINRLTRNLSVVFNNGAWDNWKDAAASFRTAQGIDQIDTLSFDDVKPGTITI